MDIVFIDDLNDLNSTPCCKILFKRATATAYVLFEVNNIRVLGGKLSVSISREIA